MLQCILLLRFEVNLSAMAYIWDLFGVAWFESVLGLKFPDGKNLRVEYCCAPSFKEFVKMLHVDVLIWN